MLNWSIVGLLGFSSAGHVMLVTKYKKRAHKLSTIFKLSGALHLVSLAASIVKIN